ncbi:uncharacterized protein LOC115278210 [Suricata suricatta]|uniref:uncharacterized protein LOC115278210 n=1 Tax=Suricata suricatta TaxID=37032 RepID=UPI0011565D54|nr:uncharacterized protein LOC115278210 [Suricata suricatta]
MGDQQGAFTFRDSLVQMLVWSRAALPSVAEPPAREHPAQRGRITSETPQIGVLMSSLLFQRYIAGPLAGPRVPVLGGRRGQGEGRTDMRRTGPPSSHRPPQAETSGSQGSLQLPSPARPVPSQGPEARQVLAARIWQTHLHSSVHHPAVCGAPTLLQVLFQATPTGSCSSILAWPAGTQQTHHRRGASGARLRSRQGRRQRPALRNQRLSCVKGSRRPVLGQEGARGALLGV